MRKDASVFHIGGKNQLSFEGRDLTLLKNTAVLFHRWGEPAVLLQREKNPTLLFLVVERHSLFFSQLV